MGEPSSSTGVPHLRLPELTRYPLWMFSAGVLVFSVGLALAAAVVSPESRVVTAPIGIIVGVVLASYLAVSHGVDRRSANGPGAFVMKPAWFHPARRVRLTPEATLELRVRPTYVAVVARTGRREVLLPLLIHTERFTRGRSAEELRVIAEEIGVSGARHSSAVARELRTQADHLTREGSLTDSPFAEQVCEVGANT